MKPADLSPDALARLEAKLVTDLEMVRKVRELLEEHALEVADGAAPPPPSPAPPVPRPLGEILPNQCPGCRGRRTIAQSPRARHFSLKRQASAPRSTNLTF